ncbi:MAG: hypothetical protein KGI51_11870, partial [Rhodospirillales bacterium]|nr:hypothetical protein [Rhodospirillales bacterium]
AEPEFVADPGLAVLAGGRRLRPVARAGATYRFALPAGVPLWLVSRASFASNARPWAEDRRRFGVMVRSLLLREGGEAWPVALDDARLGTGWWAVESDGISRWRWTDGRASLGVLPAPSELIVTLGDTVPYPVQAPRRAA